MFKWEDSVLIAAKGWWRPRDPASYKYAEKLCNLLGRDLPLFLLSWKVKAEAGYPLKGEAHNETRETEQTQLLPTPGHKRRLRKKRKAYWQHPEHWWGGGRSSENPAKPGPCLISNFKEENSSELIGPKSKYGQVRNIWSPQHPGGCQRWKLTKATGILPLPFS